MNVEFTQHGWQDFIYWMENDEDAVSKIKELIQSITRTPFKGIGKPEPLKHSLKGCWSRRINGDHRLVYKVSGTKGLNQKCTILQCRFHYDE